MNEAASTQGAADIHSKVLWRAPSRLKHEHRCCKEEERRRETLQLFLNSVLDIAAVLSAAGSKRINPPKSP